MHSPTINQYFRCLNGRWTFPHRNTFDSSLRSYFDSGVGYSSILFFFVPNTLLLLRDGKPLFREGVISKIAISLRCCQLGMKHLGVE